MWKVNYSIHYHVWNQLTFNEFLAFMLTYVPTGRMNMIERGESLADEFIYLFE